MIYQISNFQSYVLHHITSHHISKMKLLLLLGSSLGKSSFNLVQNGGKFENFVVLKLFLKSKSGKGGESFKKMDWSSFLEMKSSILVLSWAADYATTCSSNSDCGFGSSCLFGVCTDRSLQVI